jgi:hypothetical protein
MEVSGQPHVPDTLSPGKERRTHWIGSGLGLQSRSGGSREEIKLVATAVNQPPDRVHTMDYSKGNTIRVASAAGYVNIQITKHYAGTDYDHLQVAVRSHSALYNLRRRQTYVKPRNTGNYPSAAGKISASRNDGQSQVHVSTQRDVTVGLAILMDFGWVVGASPERCYTGRLHSCRGQGHRFCNPLRVNMSEVEVNK